MSDAATPATKEAGNDALAKEDFEAAIEIYTRALSDTPDDEKLHSNRSLAYYRLHKFEKAIEDADEVIRIAPTWERGYVRKALAMDKLGSSDEDVLAVYEAGALRVPHSILLARAVVGLRERLILDSKGPTPHRPPQAPDQGSNENEVPRVSWKEDELARHYAERGVMYARMKIDQPDTPFLVYDEHLAKNHNLIGTVTDKTKPPDFVDIDELRGKLGIVKAQQERELASEKAGTTNGASGLSTQDTEEGSNFEVKRQQLYRSEGDIFRQIQHNSAADA
mmetsp:Transcript_13015/g.25262  ORF Transcript_13015/g.25262 Transcript_13015/m.25262 type:complete len:279 (-) Transcript_13015:231-1067(-)